MMLFVSPAILNASWLSWKKSYTMKGVGYPQFYLGGDIVALPKTWDSKYAMSATTYITNCAQNLERMISTAFSTTSTPFDENYHPEEDNSELCSPLELSFYCSLVGSTNWCVTLGRFDIQYALSTLSQYMCAP